MEMHEVKSIWKGETRAHFEDDARVKIKVAASMYPFNHRRYTEQGRRMECGGVLKCQTAIKEMNIFRPWPASINSARAIRRVAECG